jgi:hypothetical protein
MLNVCNAERKESGAALYVSSSTITSSGVLKAIPPSRYDGLAFSVGLCGKGQSNPSFEIG